MVQKKDRFKIRNNGKTYSGQVTRVFEHGIWVRWKIHLHIDKAKVENCTRFYTLEEYNTMTADINIKRKQ